MRRTEDIAPSWRERLAALGLRELAALLNSAPNQTALPGRWQALTKPGLGGRQRWRWDVADGRGETAVYVKRYERTPWAAQWDRIRRQSFRHSLAWWEYQQSLQLAEKHIPVPRAVGFVEEMRGPFERRSAVLLESVAGDALDRAWVRACQNQAPVTRGRARHDLAQRLGRFIAAFHQTGFCHRDLYLCHVFVAWDEAAQRPPSFHLIDLARTHRPRLRRMRWLLKDLSQLDCSARQIGASRTDRLRFLLAYLGLQPGADRVRWYARRIQKKSDWILRRIARKGGAERSSK